LRRESEVLNWLKGRLPAPEVVGYHKDHSKEYLLITEVPGFMAMETGWDKKKVVRGLADGLRRIHSLPIDSCPFVYPTGELIRLAGERIRAGLVDEDDFDECRKGKRASELYEELVRTQPAHDDMVFTHGDYCLPNVILSDSGVSGFIDWGRGGVADRYRDLGIAARSITNNLGEEYIPYFFEFYGLKRVDWQKVEFFQLMDEFF
ncbi:MAG: APH(3') family aminoglycoside O-phosphotransferase, partial [Planifilum fimeticola]